MALLILAGRFLKQKFRWIQRLYSPESIVAGALALIFSHQLVRKKIGDMGQSMGVTATGILLLRMVDPRNESGVFESFAYK